MTGSQFELAVILRRLRQDLVEEATPLPGQSRAYGRPHAHPRTRYEPRFSVTGERIPGVNIVRPDCPRPIKGRCECPPDGTWRPAVGVIRADSSAQHVVAVPSVRLPGGAWPVETILVHSVYERGPDGLWRCRWPVRRALERMRGASVRRWAIAIRLLRGDGVATVWGAHGAPPDPLGDAIRILRQLERWSTEERETDWDFRPRQWWDKPREPNAGSVPKSEAQAIAEAGGLQSLDGAATMPAIGRAEPSSPVTRIGRGDQVQQPSGQPGARPPSGIPTPPTREERACA
jgi:hypothetical protein